LIFIGLYVGGRLKCFVHWKAGAINYRIQDFRLLINIEYFIGFELVGLLIQELKRVYLFVFDCKYNGNV
jgi:hypothetical protein